MIGDPCMFFKSTKNAVKANEPKFCQRCDRPSGKYSSCFEHREKCHVQLNDVEIV